MLCMASIKVCSCSKKIWSKIKGFDSLKMHFTAKRALILDSYDLQLLVLDCRIFEDTLVPFARIDK